jgi:poly(hydroxyalkanoate) granule-associated protein
MAGNRSRKRSAGSASENAAESMRDSAQKIWLAGLGAYERAKSEGPRMFEALVEQGKGLRARAAEAADQALKTVREQAGEAQGKWDKLEQVFEDRVSRSLNRLGVLTSREVGDLSRQVDELTRSVQQMMRGGGAAKPAARKARAASGRKPGAKAKAKAKKKPATRASRARRA